jgi:DNA-binding IclR family transcriptional regulator
VISQIDAVGRWSYGVRVGSEVPLFHSGSGHVLLAFQSPARRGEMLAEHRMVEGEAPMTRDELDARIEHIRRLGYERMESSQVSGIINLSYPVLGPDGSALAALTMPYMHRIDRRRIPDVESCLRFLRSAAAKLSADQPSKTEAAE